MTEPCLAAAAATLPGPTGPAKPDSAREPDGCGDWLRKRRSLRTPLWATGRRPGRPSDPSTTPVRCLDGGSCWKAPAGRCRRPLLGREGSIPY